WHDRHGENDRTVEWLPWQRDDELIRHLEVVSVVRNNHHDHEQKHRRHDDAGHVGAQIRVRSHEALRYKWYASRNSQRGNISSTMVTTPARPTSSHDHLTRA